jgi:hypothetical protein
MASYLAALNAGATVSAAADRLIRSGARIQALVDDLVDFNRSNLGLGININIWSKHRRLPRLHKLRVVRRSRRFVLSMWRL